jgi:soluble lytic murein transglycosylase-like protein
MNINYNGRVVSNDFFGTPVKASVRSKAHSRKKPVKRAKKAHSNFRVLIFLVVMSGVWYMCYKANHMSNFQTDLKEKMEVQAEEPAPSPLTKDGFEQVAPRDELPRESTNQLISRYFGKDADVAIAIAKAESGLNPNAIGDTDTKYHSVGLFQIRLLPERGISKEEMLNPEHNVQYAKMLFDKHGWSPWSVFKNGSYKKYLGGK